MSDDQLRPAVAGRIDRPVRLVEDATEGTDDEKQQKQPTCRSSAGDGCGHASAVDGSRAWLPDTQLLGAEPAQREQPAPRLREAPREGEGGIQVEAGTAQESQALMTGLKPNVGGEATATARQDL